MDGTSDLDEQVGEDEEEDAAAGLLEGDVPRTPDQEKFLKQHFETLASNGEKGTFAKCVITVPLVTLHNTFSRNLLAPAVLPHT